MKAWTHSKPGTASSVLSFSSDILKPSPTAPGDILIKISHAALNPGGSIIMTLVPMIFRSKPSIPDSDFSGTISQIAPSTPSSSLRDLEIGSKVFGSVPLGQQVKNGKGVMAEYVVVPAEAVRKVPEGLKMEEAAGLPVAGCSALVLLEKAGLKAGMKVLVNGASGGIGSLFVPMAKNSVGGSGRVVAVCSGANAEMVRGLGADEVVDYKEFDPVEKHLAKMCEAEGFDVVVDCVGVQSMFQSCARFLKEGGPYVNIGPSAPSYTFGDMLYVLGQMAKNFLLPPWLGGVGRPYIQITAIPNLQDFERLAVMVEEGKLKMSIDSTWELKDALKAYEIMNSHRARGKVIVAMSA
ncbi:hypothetical protein BJ875DRAFT_370559 [Amylocarpus encephaloides]|uniref:Enoyl reductase (ER) domain-containing protein n=1 Tax=Amylocarpus encephaloides TaxID=45428 RepID=A0A9P7YP54_9HELO|nr:hypothetical protein BJ875DRAFT_370559 [Amylocarpus encephaloides]